MPRGAGRGRRGGYDAINSEKDPNKRMVMIMEREINNFKVTNQVKDIMNKKFSQAENEVKETIVNEISVNRVFRKLLSDKSLTTDDLTTGFVAVLDCNENINNLLTSGEESIPRNQENMVEMCIELEQYFADHGGARRQIRKPRKNARNRDRINYELAKINQDIRDLKSEGGDMTRKEILMISSMIKDLEEQKLDIAQEFLDEMKEENEMETDRWEKRKIEVHEDIKEEEEIKQEQKIKKKEQELKSRRDIQNYFEKMKERHQANLKKALAKAKKRAAESSYDPNDEDEDSESSYVSAKKKKGPLYSRSKPAFDYNAKYNDYMNERLSEIKQRYKPIDYDALKKHQREIQEMIRKRKEEQDKKIKQMRSVDSNLFKIMKLYKEGQNDFFQKRSQVLENKRRVKKFDDLVRQNFKPAQARTEYDEEGNPISKRYVGHESELIKTRKRIEKNKNLHRKFFKQAKKLGRHKSTTLLVNKSLNLENDQTNTTQNLKESMPDFLKQMKKRSMRLSELEVLRKKIENKNATKEEEKLFDQMLMEANKYEEKAKRKEKYIKQGRGKSMRPQDLQKEIDEAQVDDMYISAISAKLSLMEKLERKEKDRQEPYRDENYDLQQAIDIAMGKIEDPKEVAKREREEREKEGGFAYKYAKKYGINVDDYTGTKDQQEGGDGEGDDNVLAGINDNGEEENGGGDQEAHGDDF